MKKVFNLIPFVLIPFCITTSFLNKNYFLLTFNLVFGILFCVNSYYSSKKNERTRHLKKVVNQLLAPTITEDHNSIIISILLPQEHILKELKLNVENFKGK